MGLDIIHFVEYKTSEGWKPALVQKPSGEFNDPYSDNMVIKDEIQSRNYQFTEWGIPEDINPQTQNLINDWGHSCRWVSLETLQKFYENRKHVMRYKLKTAMAMIALEKLGGKSNNDYYEQEYEWNDVKIEDKFDDIFEIESNYLYGINHIIARAEQAVSDAFDMDYVDSSKVRIIFACNN